MLFDGGALISLQKILVTTDLSEFSLAALEYAITFSVLYESKVYLLYVHDPGSSGAEDQLKEFVLCNVPATVNLTMVVRTGDPVDEIRRFAEEEEMDLIVVATHGRTGLKHMVMGSVAEKIVRYAGIPVLSVKPRPLRGSILKNEDVEKELHLR